MLHGNIVYLKYWVFGAPFLFLLRWKLYNIKFTILKSTLQGRLGHSQYCAIITCLVPEHSISPKECPVCISSHSPIPFPTPGNHWPAFWLYGRACSGRFIYMGSCNTWPLCLASLTQRDGFRVQPHCNMHPIHFTPKVSLSFASTSSKPWRIIAANFHCALHVCFILKRYNWHITLSIRCTTHWFLNIAIWSLPKH